MKHWHLAAALICLCSTAQAAPFYQTIFQDPTHPIISAGTFLDPTGNKAPLQGFAVASVYHNDPAPTTLLKSLYAQHALTLDGGYGSGNGFAGVGLAANLLPSVKTLASDGLNACSNPGQFQNVKTLLAAPIPGSVDLYGFLGPQIIVNGLQQGQLIQPSKWQGQFRILAAATLTFK